jgi:hypothetical protein
LAGCGTNLEEILFQNATALGRTAFDIFLTDVANDLADALECDGAPDDDGDDGDDGDDVDDGDGDDVDDGDGPADGAALFSNNCAMCHGADGTGPPDVTGLSAADLSAGLESAVHGSVSLTEDEVVAIAEFLGG